jgi:tRNA(fMet)-specific endonuclease VapC
MNIYVLDTDTLTLFEEGHPLVTQRFNAQAPDSVAVTVLTVEEQLSGWYTQIRKAKSAEKLAWAYRRLRVNVTFLSCLHILDYDQSAISRCEQLRKMKLKIKMTDLRIAAIVVDHNYVLVSRNRRDFERVPGLQLEDWST